MNDAKLLNRWVWCLNLLLGIGILLFSFRSLAHAPGPSLLKDVTPPERVPSVAVKPQSEGDGALKSLPNPLQNLLEDRFKNPKRPFKAILKGTLPSDKEPHGGVAFIKSTAQNAELVAYIDEEILQDGEPYEEYRGWTLSSVGRDRATFVNTGGVKVDLTIDESRSGKVGRPGDGRVSDRSGDLHVRIDTAYASDSYKSRLLASSDTQQVWGLDQNEIAWATQNAEQIFDRDFQLAPYASGGLRLEGVKAGSMGAARGLLAGDVLREVNGQPLNNISDVRRLMNNQAIKTQTGLRLAIERAGNPIVIEYRPLPR